MTTSEIEDVLAKRYEAGFVTDIEQEYAPKGLSEDIVRFISEKKSEPAWMFEWRLKNYRHWLRMKEPRWAAVSYPAIDYQDLYYWAAPKTGSAPKSLDEVDPKLLETYEKLGIPLHEREILAGVQRPIEDGADGARERPKVAVDAVFDSVSVATTFKARLAEAGVIFCAFSEAVREHPDLVRHHLGSVVGPRDNFFAALNADYQALASQL